MAAGALVTQTRIHELAYRHNGGIHVSLLWQASDNSLFVLVVDEPAGTMLRIAAERHNALDVFRHPFAYS